MAAVAIVAALKLRFARAVALGNSLGDIAAEPAKRFIGPVIRFVLPQDYKKWHVVLGWRRGMKGGGGMTQF